MDIIVNKSLEFYKQINNTDYDNISNHEFKKQIDKMFEIFENLSSVSQKVKIEKRIYKLKIKIEKKDYDYDKCIGDFGTLKGTFAKYFMIAVLECVYSHDIKGINKQMEHNNLANIMDTISLQNDRAFFMKSKYIFTRNTDKYLGICQLQQFRECIVHQNNNLYILFYLFVDDDIVIEDTIEEIDSNTFIIYGYEHLYTFFEKYSEPYRTDTLVVTQCALGDMLDDLFQNGGKILDDVIDSYKTIVVDKMIYEETNEYIQGKYSELEKYDKILEKFTVNIGKSIIIEDRTKEDNTLYYEIFSALSTKKENNRYTHIIAILKNAAIMDTNKYIYNKYARRCIYLPYDDRCENVPIIKKKKHINK